MKHLLLGVLFLVSLSFTFDKSNADWAIYDWIEIFSTKDISIAKQTLGCNDVKNGINKEYVFLKLHNNSKSQIEITFTTEVYYNNKCYSCDNTSEYTHSITLDAGSSIEGDCDNKTKGLAVFSKMLDGSTSSSLTKFEVKDVKIKKVK